MAEQERVGPWRLGVKHGRVPLHPNAWAYFVEAAAGADERMRALGFGTRMLTGPMSIEAVDHTNNVAGYYESETDELVVTCRHEPRTDWGADPGARYGMEPAIGMLAWAICHENAHRIWYRGVPPGGRRLWERFHRMLVGGLAAHERIGIARRCGAGRELASVAGVEPGRVLRAATSLPALDCLLGRLLFRGCGTDDPIEFYRWLAREEFRRALASPYAEKKAKESWAEAIASVAMEGGSPRPRVEDPVGFRVLRTVALAALSMGPRGD